VARVGELLNPNFRLNQEEEMGKATILVLAIFILFCIETDVLANIMDAGDNIMRGQVTSDAKNKGDIKSNDQEVKGYGTVRYVAMGMIFDYSNDAQECCPHMAHYPTSKIDLDATVNKACHEKFGNDWGAVKGTAHVSGYCAFLRNGGGYNFRCETPIEGTCTEDYFNRWNEGYSYEGG
jgi:hypothetical protein